MAATMFHFPIFSVFISFNHFPDTAFVEFLIFVANVTIQDTINVSILIVASSEHHFLFILVPPRFTNTTILINSIRHSTVQICRPLHLFLFLKICCVGPDLTKGSSPPFRVVYGRYSKMLLKKLNIVTPKRFITNRPFTLHSSDINFQTTSSFPLFVFSTNFQNVLVPVILVANYFAKSTRLSRQTNTMPKSNVFRRTISIFPISFSFSSNVFQTFLKSLLQLILFHSSFKISY